MFRIIFILFLIITNIRTALSSEIQLYYDIYYSSIKLGESSIHIKNDTYEASAKTVGIGDKIYPYYAKWKTYVNKYGFPQKTIIISKDRFKEREKHIIFNSTDSKVTVERIRPKRSMQSFNLTFPLYDELSAFITSWHFDYLKTSYYEIPLYIDGERHSVKIKLKGVNSCSLGNHTKTCLEIGVTLPEKSELLRRSREVTILLLQEEKIPIEIRGSLPLFGSLRARLRSFSIN